MTPLDASLFWLDQGISTVPLVYRSKKPLVPWTPYRTRLPSIEQIKLWYEDGLPHNLALVTGWCGICVLDFDNPESYSAWYVQNLIHNPAILNTYRVLSSRGVHVYYYLSEHTKLDTLQGALFEVKCAGRLVTTPPSVHESGRAYTDLDNPENIRTVTPEQILNYSPVVFEPFVFPLRQRSKYAPQNIPETESPIEVIKERVSLLSFFPAAQKIDERFYRADCPFHGHKSNFWIDTQLNICGCFAGCIGRPSLDVLDFYSRLNECDARQSIKELSYLL
jgi:hypothetical protein